MLHDSHNQKRIRLLQLLILEHQKAYYITTFQVVYIIKYIRSFGGNSLTYSHRDFY